MLLVGAAVLQVRAIAADGDQVAGGAIPLRAMKSEMKAARRC